MKRFSKNIKKKFRPVVRYWEKSPIEFIRVILEIIIVFGFITPDFVTIKTAIL